MFAWTHLPGSDDADFTPIAACLFDPDPRIRAMAVWSAGHVGASDVRNTLESLLSDPNRTLRREAKRALARLDAAGE